MKVNFISYGTKNDFYRFCLKVSCEKEIRKTYFFMRETVFGINLKRYKRFMAALVKKAVA